MIDWRGLSIEIDRRIFGVESAQVYLCYEEERYVG